MTDQPRYPRGTPNPGRGKPGPGPGRYAPIGTPGRGGWVAAVAGRLVGRGWGNDEQGRRELEQIAQGYAQTGKLPDGTQEKILNGGTASVMRWDLPDGRSIVYKNFHDDPDYYDEDDDGEPFTTGEYDETVAAGEVQASWIARAIGAPVPPVVHDPNHPNVVWMGWVDGDTPASLDYVAVARAKMAMETDQAWLLGLLDLLIFNGDRHNANWLVDPDGNPVGIDHGDAGLFTGEAVLPDGESLYYPGPFALLYADEDGVDSSVGVPARHPLHPGDIEQARTNLRWLRDQGVVSDTKLMFMESVLDRLAPRAAGDRRLIPGEVS